MKLIYQRWKNMKGKCKWTKPNEWHRRWSTRGQTRQVDKTNIGIGKLEGGMDNEHILYDSIIANYLCSHLDSICFGSTSSILLRHAACTFSFILFDGLKFINWLFSHVFNQDVLVLVYRENANIFYCRFIKGRLQTAGKIFHLKGK